VKLKDLEKILDNVSWHSRLEEGEMDSLVTVKGLTVISDKLKNILEEPWDSVSHMVEGIEEVIIVIDDMIRNIETMEDDPE
jgi:hypothetical protein